MSAETDPQVRVSRAKLCRVSLTVAVILSAMIATPARSADTRWMHLGPTAMHYDGKVIVAPSRPGTLYFGGGIFWNAPLHRSIDGGGHWVRLGPAFREVIASPVEENVLYGTTDDYDPPFLLKSEDGGESWGRADGGLGRVNALAMDPSDASTLYAGTEAGGFYRSRDDGITWHRLNQTAITVGLIRVDPRSPLVIYAGNERLRDRVLYKSTDGGHKWKLASQGLPSNDLGLTDLAIDPEDTSKLYVATALHGVYKSENGGRSWSSASAGMGAPWEIRLAIDPRDPRILWAATENGGLYKSEDAAGSWRGIPIGAPTYVTRASSVTIDPTHSDRIYVVLEDIGPVISRDGGATWKPIAVGIEQASVAAVALDPQQSGTLLASAAYSGVLKSDNEGRSWRFANTGIRSTDYAYSFGIELNPRNGLAYALVADDFYRSEDRGDTWIASGAPFQGYLEQAVMRVDPTDPLRVLAWVENRGLFETLDGGRTWRHLSVMPAELHVTGLAIDPRQSSTLYASHFAGILKSTDGGETWDEKKSSPPGRVEWWSAVAVHPVNSNVVYLGTSDGVYVSRDAGTTWTRSDKGLPEDFIGLAVPVSAFLFDRLRPDTVYIATRSGIFRSRDAGRSWTALPGEEADGDGRRVTSIAQDPFRANVLYAVADDGLWMCEIQE